MSVNHDALQDRTRGARAALWRLAGPWWLMLLTGIAWLILAWVALVKDGTCANEGCIRSKLKLS